MVQLSDLDTALREVGSGIWACIALLLAGTFVRYAWRNLSNIHDITVQGAMALSLYFMGSCLRATLNWMEFSGARRVWIPDLWETSWPVYVPSVILSIVSTAWCLIIFTPRRHAHIAAMFLALAIAVPVGFFWLGADTR